jgi:6-phosphofructokinase 1
MGRDAGHIAISAGIAGGADVILIPEIPYTLDNVCRKIQEHQAQGRNFSLVVVSEAVCTEQGETVTWSDRSGECRLGGIGQYLADQISTGTGAETRVTVLGHTQRGGIPSPLDRLIASAFGVAAVDLIADEKYDHMVTWQQRQVVYVPIQEALGHYQAVDPQGTLVKTARGLQICLGD